MFKALGVEIISADEISHQLMVNNKYIFDNIVSHFGKSVLSNATTIDRQKIRQIIFASPTDKLWLENLLHPLIKQEIKLRAKQLSSSYCVVEIPLLVEAKMQDCVDRILTLSSSPDLQIERSMQRDNSSKQDIQAIIASQIPQQQRLDHTDDLIDNNSDLDRLKQKVIQQHEFYLQLIASKN
jgi:dephospho-CoA kinase